LLGPTCPLGLGGVHQAVGEPVAAFGTRGDGQLTQGRAGDRGVLVGAEQILHRVQAPLQPPRGLADDRRGGFGGVAQAFGRFALWVPATLSTSCDLLIFVKDAAETVVSFDLVDLGWRAVGERS